ncbi:MAG: SixA phosphatase family protein [Marinibacterium sp.]
MTRRLILMRHAKSSWSDPGLPDHDRPLNKRGKRSARVLGAWLRANRYLPDQAVCSTALRARQTLDGLDMDLSAPPVPDLYHAGVQTVLRILRGADGQCVLVIGHNPGLAAFAQSIVLAPPRHPRFADFPTGATLVADVDIRRWTDLHHGCGKVRAFVVPRELSP